ncbi:hypothetical protein PAHAL_7G152200 [Panicum hallii]|uniref:Uncharacterized protein n=1 Tax=Panicum hallii TaxID=206008 RepID=A0A2S3I6M6_9POAL|nr:hypothetical protein PAHAL_7G152200 [Panicum hallii]
MMNRAAADASTNTATPAAGPRTYTRRRRRHRRPAAQGTSAGSFADWWLASVSASLGFSGHGLSRRYMHASARTFRRMAPAPRGRCPYHRGTGTSARISIQCVCSFVHSFGALHPLARLDRDPGTHRSRSRRV